MNIDAAWNEVSSFTITNYFAKVLDNENIQVETIANYSSNDSEIEIEERITETGLYI